jgi:hypothetical protein
MPLTVRPVGKVVHVCDDVIVDSVSHKPTLLNLWEIVRIPVGSVFPYTLGKVCIVALMRGGLGEGPFRVDVSRTDTNDVIRRSRDYPVNFGDRRSSRLVVIRLVDVVFPTPGAYLLELFCEGLFVDDRLIEVLSPESEGA